MLTGLRLTEIKSDGFDYQFSRYQLSEHELTPLKDRFFWGPGKIIHHVRSWQKAIKHFNKIAPKYNDHGVALSSPNSVR